MKERPILFSTAMVRAILAGNKTQTRRIIKPQPDDKCVYETNNMNDDIYIVHPDGKRFSSPYGQPGDILWVREGFCRFSIKQGEKVIHEGFLYKASYPDDSDIVKGWKPSIHMPKAAARIWLQIESIKVERLHDITEEDAIAEGIKKTWIHDNPQQCKYKNYINDGAGSLMPCESFYSLWISINGADSYQSNPWVWAITFKVLSTTGKPATLTTQY